MAEQPALPPSPLSQEAPEAALDARLPWSTLLYALPTGVPAGIAQCWGLSMLAGPQSLRLSDVGGAAVIGVVEVEVLGLALIVADRLTCGVARWAAWAAVLAGLAALPSLAFAPAVVAGVGSGLLTQWMLSMAATGVLAGGVAGALMGLAARSASGLSWRFPFAAAAAAVAGIASDSLLTAALRSRWALPPLDLLGLESDLLVWSPGLMAVGLAAALGLQSARRKAGAARCAPTEA